MTQKEKITNFLQKNDRWVTTKEIAISVNIEATNVHKVLRRMNNVCEDKKNDGGRYLHSWWKLTETGLDALDLAYKHRNKGVWAQLFWTKWEGNLISD